MHIVGAQFIELNINSEMEEYFTLMQGPDGLTHAVLGSRGWVKCGFSSGHLGVGRDGPNEWVGPSVEGTGMVSFGYPWSVSKSSS